MSGPTAVLRVEVHPDGRPGMVQVRIEQEGPEILTPGEAVQILAYALHAAKTAADELAREEEDVRPGSGDP